MNDLVERLRSLDEAIEKQDGYGIANDVVREAITALSTPTSEGVHDMCNQLRDQLLLTPMKNGGEMVTGIGEYAADLIERLARINVSAQKHVHELLQRIEELEEIERALLVGCREMKRNIIKRAERAEQQRDKYKQFLSRIAECDNIATVHRLAVRAMGED